MRVRIFRISFDTNGASTGVCFHQHGARIGAIVRANGSNDLVRHFQLSNFKRGTFQQLLSSSNRATRLADDKVPLHVSVFVSQSRTPSVEASRSSSPRNRRRRRATAQDPLYPM